MAAKTITIDMIAYERLNSVRSDRAGYRRPLSHFITENAL
jgi:predicted CopG family antitoxin